MQLLVQPTKIGVIVMKNQNEIDLHLTQKLKERRFILTDEAEHLFTFRPILQANFLTNGSVNDLITVVKFEYRKDQRMLWAWPQPQVFEAEATFYPDILFNLERYRNRNLLGLWEVKAGVVIIRQQDLTEVSGGNRVNYLLSLDYQEIASFQWEVVNPIAQVLTPSGMLVRQRSQPEWRRNVSVSVDQI